MRWAIVQRVDRLRVPVVWLEDVPEGVKAPAIKAALEDAGRSIEFSAGARAWGNHTIVPEHRWPTTWDHGVRVRTWKWDSIQPKAGVRVSILVSTGLHSRLTLAAAAAGIPMATWAVNALERQLEQLETVGQLADVWGLSSIPAATS